MSDELRFRAIAGVGRMVLDALLATARFSTEGDEHVRGEMAAGRPVIFTPWHGRLLPLTYYHRTWHVATLISASRDGEYIARIARAWGYEVVRGSSSRDGGPALRELVRLVRSGRTIAVTPDGPRGPREQLKPGVLAVARLTGCALLPVGAGTRRAWWFEGWDRFLVPKPFARIRIVYGEPIFVPREAADADLDAFARRTEEAIRHVTEMADAHSDA